MGHLNTYIKAIYDLYNSSPIEFIKFISPVINTIVFFVGVIFTVMQIRNAVKSREHQNVAAIFARNSDLNKKTEDNKYRRMASLCFVNFSGNYPQALDEDEEDSAYWGARSFLMDLLTLILQIWIIAGKPKALRGDYAGWDVVARSLSKELTIGHPDKPKWYEASCRDLKEYINRGRVYPPEFIKWFNSL